MLAWSSGGAVETPTAVQIRVQRSYPGRVRAGAPVPTRSMTPDEIAGNLRYFTEGLDTPRSAPCQQLVLSGVGVATRPDTPQHIALARSLGISRIVLHVGGEDLDALQPHRIQGVDELVVPVQPGSGTLLGAKAVLQAAAQQGLTVTANVPLTSQALDELEPAARMLAAAQPHRVTYTYPFPVNGSDATNAPPPGRALFALRAALDVLEGAGVEVALKGLPACYLGDEARILAKSRNRFYVDADHQRDQALLFFPAVVAFHKQEACRFCRLNERCDGFFATYLSRPGYPPLRPVD